MDRSDAWQMAIGNTTPAEVAEELGTSSPEQYVAAVISECVVACSMDEDGYREDELREALEEHADAMAELIREAMVETLTALVAERDTLALALDECERGAFPGSRAQRREAAALRALATFDRVHPEALAEIERRHREAMLGGKDIAGL